jgi:hypothetical protein
MYVFFWSVDQGLLVRDAFPLSAWFDPGIGKAPTLDEGLATIRALGSKGTGDPWRCLRRVERWSLSWRFPRLEAEMTIDADKGARHDRSGRVYVMVDFRLIPGALERPDLALIRGAVVRFDRAQN